MPQTIHPPARSISAPAAPLAHKPGSAELPPRPPKRRWLRRVASNLIIVGVLAGLAYWGHRTDWTLPKFSALLSGNPSSGGEQCAPGEDGWCKEHNVPEAICIECNTKLVPAEEDYGWCAEHGIAQCPLDHPEVAQLKTIPTVTNDDMNRAKGALALLPRAENNSHCKLYQRRIQFASTEAIEKAGVDIAVVDQKPLVEAVAANGEIVYDETHTAHLASRVAGTVWRVEKKVGDQVRKGDILALVDAAEVGRAKADLLQAIANLRRETSRCRSLAAAGQQRRGARQTIARSRGRLAGSTNQAAGHEASAGESWAAGENRRLRCAIGRNKSHSRFNFSACRTKLSREFRRELDHVEFVSAAFAAGWRGGRSQNRRRRSRRHQYHCCSSLPTCGGCG